MATRQVACFRVGSADCAVDVMRIAEVLRPVPVTPLPAAPPFVEGLIELRGRFLPVVDLRARFGADRPQASDRVRYIVAPQDGAVARAGALVALAVDEVTGVESIPDQLIQPAPSLANSPVAAPFVAGLIRWDNRVLLLLDLDAILSPEQKRELAAL